MINIKLYALDYTDKIQHYTTTQTGHINIKALLCTCCFSTCIPFMPKRKHAGVKMENTWNNESKKLWVKGNHLYNHLVLTIQRVSQCRKKVLHTNFLVGGIVIPSTQKLVCTRDFRRAFPSEKRHCERPVSFLFDYKSELKSAPVAPA